MLGIAIDVEGLINQEKNIGTSSLLLGGAYCASQKMAILEDIYQDALDGDLSEEKRGVYLEELGKLFVRMVLLDQSSTEIQLDPSFSPEMLQVGSPEFDEMIRVCRDRGEGTKIEDYIAHLYNAVKDRDPEAVVRASNAFRRTSMETFDVDLPRMGELEIEFDDKTKRKLFEFMGYSNITEMREDTKEGRSANFLRAMREQGVDDKAIANIVTNLNQKALLSGSAYTGILCAAANPGHHPEVNHSELIVIDRKNHEIKIRSKANILFRKMEDMEDMRPAFVTNTEYKIPFNREAVSDKTLDVLMQDTMGYAVMPRDSSMQVMPLGHFQLPDVSKVTLVRDLNYEDLDKILPPFDKEDFTIQEVRQTFSELFGLQRGAAFSYGVEGRLVDIICEERKVAGQTKIKSLEGVEIKEGHIRKLVLRLAEEQQDQFEGVDLEKVTEETIDLIKLRSRLNQVAPEKKLPFKNDGPKFERFSFMYEFWNKIKHVFRVYDAAKNITKAEKLDIERRKIDARSGGFSLMYPGSKDGRSRS